MLSRRSDRDATLGTMQDRELYRQILGISAPWFVERVDLKLESGEVHVYLDHHGMINWSCPECGAECKLYDHQPERQWRHLDTCQYQTILHAKPPRAECDTHGVRVVKLPWAEPASRFTALFERLAIDWLKAASQKAVSERLALSWDEIHGIMERAVARGLKRRTSEAVPKLGVDEKAFRKGHQYFTLVNDLEQGRVLYIAEDRTRSSLDGFWETLTDEQRTGITAIAMDMWDPYVNSTREHLTDADSKIVFDKFHIAKHLGEAVDRVRRRENKTLRSAGDDRLSGTRYDWLKNPAKMEPQDRKAFAALRNSNLKTARAWALKEAGMAFFEYVYERPARKHFRWWHGWATRSRLQPMIDVARMLKRRFENVVTYLRHRVTNAASESINSRIQWVKYTARGFRNKANFRTAIYFHCGGLDLMPSH
jgi:transposase